jgi:hypothetical protein
MASTLARFQSSGFLPVGTPKIPCLRSFCRQEEALHHSIVDARQSISNNRGFFGRMQQFLMRGIEALLLQS